MNKKNFLGVKLPIIQAPMAGVQDNVLAAAVSIAGGLGSIPSAAFNEDQLRFELSTIKSVTSEPFNLNFFCHTQVELDIESEYKWREELKKYYEEYKIDPMDIPTGFGLNTFSEKLTHVVEEFRPEVVSFHFGLPSRDLMTRVKSCSKVLASATTVEEAMWLEKQGVDGIIAQGIEAGGHRGMFLTEDIDSQLSTFELLSKVLQRVKIPVISAGGIANSKDVAKALSMGASAVQVGTAYLLCPEANTSPIHRKALQSDAVYSTAITNVFSGRPARSIVNRLIEETGPINRNTPPFPFAGTALSPIRRQAEEKGLSDFTPLWCGENGDQCKVISAGELTAQLAKDI